MLWQVNVTLYIDRIHFPSSLIIEVSISSHYSSLRAHRVRSLSPEQWPLPPPHTHRCGHSIATVYSPFHCTRPCWASEWAWWSPWTRRITPERKIEPRWLLSLVMPSLATVRAAAASHWSEWEADGFSFLSRWRCTRGAGLREQPQRWRRAGPLLVHRSSFTILQM